MFLQVRELYYDDTPDAVAIEHHIKYAKAFMMVVKMTWPNADCDGKIIGYHSVCVTPDDTVDRVQTIIYNIVNETNHLMRIIDQGGVI